MGLLELYFPGHPESGMFLDAYGGNWQAGGLPPGRTVLQLSLLWCQVRWGANFSPIPSQWVCQVQVRMWNVGFSPFALPLITSYWFKDSMGHPAEGGGGGSTGCGWWMILFNPPSNCKKSEFGLALEVSFSSCSHSYCKSHPRSMNFDDSLVLTLWSIYGTKLLNI